MTTQYVSDEGSPLSVEEQREWLNDLAKRREELKADLEQQVQALEAILLSCNPFDLLGHLFFVNAVFETEQKQEEIGEKSDVYLEYATLLLLTRDANSYPQQSHQKLTSAIIDDIQQRIRHIFRLIMLSLITQDVDTEREGPPDSLHHLRTSIMMRSTIVRYPSYHHHLRDVLHGLFDPLEQDLERLLGFTLSDAMVLIDSIEALILDRLLTRYQEAKHYRKTLTKLIEAERRKVRTRKRQKAVAIPTEGDIDGLISYLASLRPREAQSILHSMRNTWIGVSVGETLSFTVQDLVQETQLAETRVRAFLENFSLQFGDIDPAFYRLPAPTHPFMTKPFIQLGERYLCPVKELAYWSLRPALEGFLNPQHATSVNADPVLWARYQKRLRAEYVEERAIAYISQALRYASSYRRLTYWVGNQKFELDGLVVSDSVAFLIEAKAGSLSLPARRGALKSLLKDLRQLVGEAAAQLQRAKDYIEQTDAPTFVLENGNSVALVKQHIKHLFLVSVTLDSFDALVTNCSQFADLGLFINDAFPWSVSLTDLRVISELTEFSSEFIHYLFRRLQVNKLKQIRAYDELEWFGHYLHEGLYFNDLLEGSDVPDMIHIDAYAQTFDDYYLYVTGQRQTPAPKPIQPMPQIMHDILEELERQHPVHYREVSCTLLDMASTARESFCNLVQQQRQRTILDRGFHDGSFFVSETSTGLTCMFATSENSLLLYERLLDYCICKKHQAKYNRWIGLGFLVDIPHAVAHCLILDEPWQYDDILQQRVAMRFPQTQL